MVKARFNPPNLHFVPTKPSEFSIKSFTIMWKWENQVNKKGGKERREGKAEGEAIKKLSLPKISVFCEFCYPGPKRLSPNPVN